MILHIENLGAIRRADIDLNKRFLLFCGCNGTGKTYAAYVLQAFLGGSGLYPDLCCLSDIAGRIAREGKFRIEMEHLVEWLRADCKSVMERVGVIFGISDGTAAKLFGQFALDVEYTDADYKRSLATPLAITLTEGSSIWRISKAENDDVVSIESNVDLAKGFASGSLLVASIVCGILRTLAFCGMQGVRMLTVERNSIYTFKTELSLSRNELIDRIQQKSDKGELDIIGMLNSSSRRYPEAVSNSLRVANDLGNVQKHSSPYAGIADRIEQRLLNGEVSVTKEGDVEFRSRSMAKSRRLPFHLSSSIVKTMASLVIYLRHIAGRGDTLIIDEPEMNFHPDVQVELARIFAMLTANGMRVVVSTHSDYIVREMNNLIMARSLSDIGKCEIISELGYEEQMLLSPDDTDVLFFRQDKRGKVRVNALPIEKTGFAVSTIDEVITSQNNVAQSLYCELTDEI